MMTYLELIGEIGSIPMEVARMYLKGKLTGKELNNVLGRTKAAAVECYRQSTFGESQRNILETACTREREGER